MKISKIVQVVSFFGVINFSYWIFINELVIWNKSISAALTASSGNVFGLILCVTFFVGLSWKKFKPLFESIPGFDYDLRIPFFSGTESVEEVSEAQEDFEVPAAWIEGRADIEEVPEAEPEVSPGSGEVRKKGPRTVRITGKKPPRKIRIPGLLRFKQLCAVILLAVNVFMSQGSLLSGDSRGLFWYFLFQGWICLEFLWRSRKKTQKLQEAEK